MCHCLLEADNSIIQCNSKITQYSTEEFPLKELLVEPEELFVGKIRTLINTEILKKLKQEYLGISRQIKLYEDFLLNAHSSKVLARCVALLFRCCFALFRTQETAEDFSFKTGLFFLESFLFRHLSDTQRSNYVALSERCIKLVSNFFARQIKRLSSIARSNHDNEDYSIRQEDLLYTVTPFMQLFQAAESRYVYTAKELILLLPNSEKTNVARWHSMLHALSVYGTRLEKFCGITEQILQMVRSHRFWNLFHVMSYREVTHHPWRERKAWRLLFHRSVSSTTTCILSTKNISS